MDDERMGTDNWQRRSDDRDKAKILCADDEPKILKFLEAILVKNDYEVIPAENGEEALEKLKEKRA